MSWLCPKERINPSPDAVIHPNEGRPRPFEPFTGEFLGRVNAEFGADGDFAGGVVEHVGGAFGENAVPPSPRLWRTGALRFNPGETV